MKIMPGVATAIMLAMGPQALADPISFKGVCTITTGSIGGKNFAALKCYKKSDPGHYNIRTTIWERKNKEEFRNLARHAGRRFTCTFTEAGMMYLPAETSGVDMTDCR